MQNARERNRTSTLNPSAIKALTRWDFLSYPESYPSQSRAVMGPLGICWASMSRQRLGAVAVIDDRLQALAISRAQIDGDASTHPADSLDAKAMGIPTRTLTSASIH